ncbi:MAG TPA: cytochrome c biogenesis protein CcsA, partial [Gemmata sp.]|nr:cytochrome c biogenesis protein CcsA [Gemmata sp.]
ERREGYRYSLEEIAPKIGDLQRAMDKARPREGMPKPLPDARIDNLFESGDRDIFAAQVMETAERVQLYVKLCNLKIPLTIPPAHGKDWQSLADAQESAQRTAVLAAFQDRGLLPKDFDSLSEETKKQLDEDARSKLSALVHSTPGLLPELDLIAAYKSGDAARFSTALAAYRDETATAVNAHVRAKVNFEVFLNTFAPTYQVIYLYVLAFVLALAGWVALLFRPTLAAAFRKSAFWLLVLAFGVHGFALFARMYLTDRPLVFVTNLYSTAVFIGWAAVGMGLVMERIIPIGLGNLAAAVVGGATAIVAHNLATSGDTLEMMVAVLDTNFWLATHVTTINLGYAATYVAGVIGIVYLVLGIFTPVLSESAGVAGVTSQRATIGRLLGQLMYGVVCLATLLSFVGTVLGGIWADYSWGRFWGWDPKENGAVLIVLWNALVLHARWCGLVKDRGVAVLTLGGIMITTWSYFGTNQLGVGLHNYGFNNALATGCMVTWMTSLVLIGMGLIPLKYWRSFASQAAASTVARQESVHASRSHASTTTEANGRPENNGHPRQGKRPHQGKRG